MGKLRKVPLTLREVEACLRAFGGDPLPQRSGSSHRRWVCWVGGQKRLVTVSLGIGEYGADSHTVLWSIVQKQLQVSWETFYAADPSVARRAGVTHQTPTTGKPATAN